MSLNSRELAVVSNGYLGRKGHCQWMINVPTCMFYLRIPTAHGDPVVKCKHCLVVLTFFVHRGARLIVCEPIDVYVGPCV